MHFDLSHRIGLDLAAHRRVFACFFLYAFGFGGFFPRLAEIQRDMGVGEGALGLALIGTAAGTLISLSFAGRLLERIGHRRVLLGLLPVVPVFYAIAAHAPGPVVMFFCLLPAGLCIGAVEVIVNLEADRVEHHGGRRIMNRSHAFWSFGFFSAAAIGALMSALGVGPKLHLALMVLVSLAATQLLLGRFEAAPPRPGSNTEEAPHFAMPTWAIGALVGVSVAALVLEGAGFDWSAIYMRDVFQSSATLGGVAVATGALSQALTRYIVDRYVERHGPVRVARVLMSLLGLGNLLVFFAPAAPLALAGFALMGIGSSAVFPLAMSAAAQRTDRPAPVNVAALALVAFGTFMLAPPLLGLVAEHWGIRWSFGVCFPLVLVGLALSGTLGAPARRAAVTA